jgi:uncharacterized integral membrane protein
MIGQGIPAAALRHERPGARTSAASLRVRRYSRAVADPNQTPQGGKVRREGNNWRQWLLWTVALLLAIIVLQNLQEVHVDILFLSTKAPLIVLLLIAGAIGAVIGYTLPVVRRHRRDERRREETR